MNWIGSFTHVASYITAVARMNLIEGIMDVGVENLYYCDTDSIVTNIPLPLHKIG